MPKAIVTRDCVNSKEEPDRTRFVAEKEPSKDAVRQLIAMIRSYAGQYFSDDFADNIEIDAPYQRLCYLINGETLVSAVLFTVLDGCPHITVMVTGKDYRHKGYGKQLMECFVNYVSRLGFRSIELYAWFEKTKPVCGSTQAFYRSAGFSAVSEHLGLWERDMITVKMKKSWQV